MARKSQQFDRYRAIILAAILSAQFATLLRAEAAGALPRQEPEAPGVARLTAGLRAKFDPRGLFNAEALARSA